MKNMRQNSYIISTSDSWRDLLGMLYFVASYTYVVTLSPFYIALCLLCSVDIFIAYAMSFFCFSIFMINNDLYSVMIILWLVCDNVVSTVRFSLLKLVKFSFLFFLFATGFITPVNKDYHKQIMDQKRVN